METKKTELEQYIESVVYKLLSYWDSRFNNYTGIDYAHIETMITDPEEKYDLIKKTVYDLWEDGVKEGKAAESLFYPLNQYFHATASVM